MPLWLFAQQNVPKHFGDFPLFYGHRDNTFDVVPAAAAIVVFVVVVVIFVVAAVNVAPCASYFCGCQSVPVPVPVPIPIPVPGFPSYA